MPVPPDPIQHPATRPADLDAGRERDRPRVHPLLDVAAAHAWRLIVIGVVALALLWFLRQVRVVAFPVVVALFVARALSPVARGLRRHGWRPGLAAIASMLLLFSVVGGVLAAVVPAFADELGSIGPTLTEAIDDVEDWLVVDSPWEISRADVDQVRERVGEQVADLTRTPDGSLSGRAALVAEFVTGTFLALVLTFFMLRDGRRFSEWLVRSAPGHREHSLRRALAAAWTTLAGYLKGATALGLVESAIIGLALFLSGGSLVPPVMAITFIGAYVPLIGAIVSALVAVLVALVSGGVGAALVVGVVALVVQQLDNELLAPLIYGRALDLHPVVILVSVVAGSALFGIAGTLLAVPLVAVTWSAARELRRGESLPPGEESAEPVSAT